MRVPPHKRRVDPSSLLRAPVRLPPSRAPRADDIEPGVLEREVRVVIREILSSLAHMHDQGMLHKDVKLENLVREAAAQALRWCVGCL